MTFLHPWALWLGLAAAGLPVVIHWLTRPRPIRLPLSTVRFVREAVRQRRSRSRLRDWLILALRTLAVLLLAWAVARPVLGERPLIVPGEGEAAARVVLLDVSQSMAANVHGIQMVERARPAAAAYLADQVGVQANLILAGARPRPAFDRLSTNFAALREELAQARPRPERLNAQAAINLASDLLATASTQGQRRELVIVSDLQKTSWSNVDLSVLPEDTRIQLESVAPAEELPNLAILRVGSRGRVEQGRPVRLEVDVGNFSSTPRKVQVEVSLGQATYHLEGLCAGSRTTLTADIAPPGVGWLSGEGRLTDVEDVLPGDNVRSFVLEVRPPPTYALITRQPADLRPSSSYYLERALVPAAPGPGTTGSRVVRLPPSHLERDALAGAALLVLDHPGELSDEAIRLLAADLRGGQGLLYVASEPADAVNLRALAEAAGSEFQTPVTFVPAAVAKPRRDLFLIEVRREQAPFRIFGDELSALLGPLRFSGGLATRPRDNALADDLLAQYSDRSACLVAGSCGSGSLAVLNADLSASNLPGSPLFVPWIGELTDRLVGSQRLTEAAVCGEPWALTLPASAGPTVGLQVVGPAGAEGAGRLEEEGGRVLWRHPEVERPGVYSVQRGERVVFAVAAGVPADESNLEPIAPKVLTENLSGGRLVHYRGAAEPSESRDFLWTWLAVACVACLLGELLALKWFRT
jgi:hypothetical protein